MKNHARERLAQEIVSLSVADSWEKAKREWELIDVYVAEKDEPGTCLCGHAPILEHCVLRNRANGKQAVVGNVCVTRFMGIDSGRLFKALARVAANPDAALNEDAVQHAHKKGWINDWERTFYLSTLAKRRPLSAKQRAKRREINTLVLYRVRRTATDRAGGTEAA